MPEPFESPPFPAPEGFVWRPHLFATIETAAEMAGVNVRTVYYWLERPDDPLPASYVEGKSPLISVAAMVPWLALRRALSPSFGKHGGER